MTKKKKKKTPPDKKNCAIIQFLLLQLQMTAYFGLGISTVALLSENPDFAIKSQPLVKQLQRYTK